MRAPFDNENEGQEMGQKENGFVVLMVFRGDNGWPLISEAHSDNKELE